MSQIIYGLHPVKEALKSSRLKIQKILIGTKIPQPSLQEIIDLAKQRKVPVEDTSKNSLEQLTQGKVHQNVIAFVQEIPFVPFEEMLFNWRKEERRATFLILDGIQDPQNFGSLIRTALGCGAHGIIIPKDRSVGITPGVVKASAGAITYLPIAQVVNIARTIDLLKKEGIWIYGASGEAKDLIYQIDFNVDLAIIIGAEGKGMRPLVKKKCDQLFSIPMKGPLNSFNASVTGGMILYEVMRQRFLKSHDPSRIVEGEGEYDHYQKA